MSRKSLIICLSVMAFMLLGLGVAIAVLYSGTGGGKDDLKFEGDRLCLNAVPSDAVLVSCFDNVSDACEGVLSGFAFFSSLSEKIEDGTMASLRRCDMAVSLHYIGRIYGLFVIDLSRASDETVSALAEFVDQSGLSHTKVGGFMAISSSEALIRSSLRHFDKNVSVVDAPGFTDALSSVDAPDILLLPTIHAQKLMPSLLAGSMARQHSFVERIADWLAFDIDGAESIPIFLEGTMLYEGDADEFLTVLEDCTPSVSQVAEVLPDFTFSLVTFPLKGMDEYISSYQSFIDSRQGLQTFKSRQNSLADEAGIRPEDFVKLLDIKELASATFMAGSRLEKVNLIRSGSKDLNLIFKGNEVESLKNCPMKLYKWAYPSFIASVFGKQFSLQDETCFTYIDGWIITGSSNAIDEYVENKALDYTLKDYLADAGKSSLLSEQPALAVAYVSLTEDREKLSSFIKPQLQSYVTSVTGGCDFAPAVLYLSKDKRGIVTSFDIHTLSMKKTKAPSHDRDTVVTVPSGPFKVRNSGTGKMNTFYQNKQNAICLQDENGKDLWGVPLGKKICGTAYTIDYYANGKLQILFGAGSDIYLIDRLGRYVNGFPLALGKEIALGPDVYDFSGSRRYNIMVLHKDNTVQMYNLKGKKPQDWKGITADETIKSLPERLTLSGKDFWVVRTSIQTLIFPFYGGSPLTIFEGDGKLRPDTEIKKVDDSSVQALSYDGKVRTIKLIE